MFILFEIAHTSATVATTTVKIIPKTNIILSFLYFIVILLSLTSTNLLEGLELYLQFLIPRFMPSPATNANTATATIIIPNAIIFIILSMVL